MLAVTIPANVPTGCFVSISAVATVGNESIVGNTPTIPIAANGGACSDPQLGYDGNQISTLNATGTVKTGFLIVSNSLTVTDIASATFRQSTGITSAGGATVSIGSCILNQPDPFTTTTPIGLDLGTLAVTGPGGASATLVQSSQSPGFYITGLPAIPSTGATYVFNASGGSQVGSFSATVNFPNPRLVWTNRLDADTVNRASGLTVAWTGGVPGSYVSITGSSAFTSYACLAPQSAGTFTVPSYILQGMYPAAGNTKVTNWTNFSAFSASGLDFGGAMGYFSVFMVSSYR